jgi:hypothetical protein
MLTARKFKYFNFRHFFFPCCCTDAQKAVEQTALDNLKREAMETRMQIAELLNSGANRGQGDYCLTLNTYES